LGVRITARILFDSRPKPWGLGRLCSQISMPTIALVSARNFVQATAKPQRPKWLNPGPLGLRHAAFGVKVIELN
jgi:hypothetical protein